MPSREVMAAECRSQLQCVPSVLSRAAMASGDERRSCQRRLSNDHARKHDADDGAVTLTGSRYAHSQCALALPRCCPLSKVQSAEERVRRVREGTIDVPRGALRWQDRSAGRRRRWRTRPAQLTVDAQASDQITQLTAESVVCIRRDGAHIALSDCCLCLRSHRLSLSR